MSAREQVYLDDLVLGGGKKISLRFKAIPITHVEEDQIQDTNSYTCGEIEEAVATLLNMHPGSQQDR